MCKSADGCSVWEMNVCCLIMHLDLVFWISCALDLRGKAVTRINNKYKRIMRFCGVSGGFARIIAGSLRFL